ncbi:helix-turn-helix transcriptional regulator [Mangrovibacterium diazotrophicum]|uniref:DNA-binding NarL/FixJ family response regulator n=1 Tax=Mangrovibacterium diazotrophicum TaxID=1261403 RepID=A0A419W7J2_9BACT|nr:LuxR C-terminal-related transcriptional regulator [Mangrovibacterium diazotrophicum]RKD91390.1 DNA-binding NarL/FixJ family response regulator [Mangrovibacterium diazotrophicum]
MEENVFIIHPSEILRKGLAWILKEYFKIEITQLSEINDIASFTGISGSLIIIIIQKGLGLPPEVDERLRRNNNLYLVSLSASTDTEGLTAGYDYDLNVLDSNLEIQKLIQVIRKSATKAKTQTFENGDLTQREKDVIRHIALGLSNKEMADKLNISIHTVISHRKNITEKLNIKSISGLTVYAIMNNLLDISDINPEELI